MTNIRDKFDVLETQVGESILPPSSDVSINDESDFRKQFGARAQLAEQLMQAQDESGISRIKSWLAALNRFDRYASEELDSGILRPNQIPIMQDIHRFVESGERRGYLWLPTGYGKTVIFTEILRILDMQSLVVVPRKKLIHQTADRLDEFASEMEHGKVFQDEKVFNRQTTIITYQSLIPMLQSGQISGADYDVIIFDEAHNALSKNRKASLEHFRDDAFIISATATPRYTLDKQVSNILPYLIHRVPARDAIMEGSLCPVQVFLVKTNIDLSSVPILSTGDFSAKELENEVNNAGRNKAAVDLYLKAFQGRKAVAFCAGIKHAEDVAKSFQDAGVSAAAIHSKMKLAEQEAAYESYARGELHVIAGDKIFTEGFDDEETAVCLNLKPTLSLVDAEQRGGRALRVFEDKYATVIDFIDQSPRPCILFADIIGGTVVPPDVAPKMHKRMQKDKEKLKNLSIQGIEIETNEEKILELGAMVQEHIPEGWIEQEVLATELEITTKSLAYLVRRKILCSDIGTGRFRKSDEDKVYIVCYSPAIAMMARDEMAKLPGTPEPGWLSKTQLEERYRYEERYKDRLLSKNRVALLPYISRSYFDITYLIREAVEFLHCNGLEQKKFRKTGSATLQSYHHCSPALVAKIDADLESCLFDPDKFKTSQVICDTLRIGTDLFHHLSQSVLRDAEENDTKEDMVQQGVTLSTLSTGSAVYYYSQSFLDALMIKMVEAQRPTDWQYQAEFLRDNRVSNYLFNWWLRNLEDSPEIRSYLSEDSSNLEPCISSVTAANFLATLQVWREPVPSGWCREQDILTDEATDEMRSSVESLLPPGIEKRYFLADNQNWPDYWVSSEVQQQFKDKFSVHKVPSDGSWILPNRIKDLLKLQNIPDSLIDDVVEKIIAELKRSGQDESDFRKQLFYKSRTDKYDAYDVHYSMDLVDRVKEVILNTCRVPNSEWKTVVTLQSELGCSFDFIISMTSHANICLTPQISDYQLQDDKVIIIPCLNDDTMEFEQYYSPAFCALVRQRIEGDKRKKQQLTEPVSGFTNKKQEVEIKPIEFAGAADMKPLKGRRFQLIDRATQAFPELGGCPLMIIPKTHPLHSELSKLEPSVVGMKVFVMNVEADLDSHIPCIYIVPRELLEPFEG